MSEARDQLEQLKHTLCGLKKPKIDPDREEVIEEDVGDSVSEAYCEGYSDGCRIGEYKLAQKLLKLMT